MAVKLGFFAVCDWRNGRTFPGELFQLVPNETECELKTAPCGHTFQIRALVAKIDVQTA
jgi:hypothetical protein